MIIDCHQHLAPDIIPMETIIAQMDKTGIDKIALMAIPCGPTKEPSPFFISVMRFLLMRSWLRPLSKKTITRFTEDGDFRLPTSVIKILKKPDNPLVFEATERYPDRFLAWCMVNPGDNQNALAEYDRWKDHPACVGVKAHPFWHQYALKKLLPVAERLIEKKAPLIVHLGFGDNGDILSFADELPELKIIIAHAGFPCYSDTWKIIKNRKNILVDLSATTYVDEKIMADVASFLGIERCLYGTDGPFGSHNDHKGFDMGLIKRRIEKVFPDKGHQRMILGENFMNFITLNK